MCARGGANNQPKLAESYIQFRLRIKLIQAVGSIKLMVKVCTLNNFKVNRVGQKIRENSQIESKHADYSSNRTIFAHISKIFRD
jgi:hypothetical protein